MGPIGTNFHQFVISCFQLEHNCLALSTLFPKDVCKASPCFYSENRWLMTLQASILPFTDVHGKLRQLNQLRPKIGLESDLNCLLMNFFNPNSWLESESSLQNRIYCFRIQSKSLNFIERDRKEIENVQI